MNQVMALDLMRSAFMTTIKASAPILIIAMVVGLIISILQATTQVQEQTLTFVPKMIAVLLSLILLGAFMMNTLIAFMNQSFDVINRL
ncbi:MULTISPECIES: flagellar biosynthesis protein FliQ [Proteiniclasticum]|jgi:flagellar biosynthetic protein FliQ|uniref:Flagellar biosynthetic protein FliQ n=1 Tax=Proteiniclasticum ruminis TaxID=398199 RepID=A0A1I5C8U1_9CLOT|nr:MULTISPECIES: flagellar biosynthesis protein FliQ [Proteiniclasticum]SFN83244.1 flagellar biosynthetic protein FliQ [Proteiniclasticum ruminis]HBW13708.1 flagellar biosynthetic protein FliQ [Proteiniclasticum sp.]